MWGAALKKLSGRFCRILTTRRLSSELLSTLLLAPTGALYVIVREYRSTVHPIDAIDATNVTLRYKKWILIDDD